jgi:hypothetical protein
MTRKQKNFNRRDKKNNFCLGEDETKTIKKIAATVDFNCKIVSAVLRGIHEIRSSLVTPSIEGRNYESQEKKT